ncbi:hypothetical protein [Ferruginibacter sp. SUN106]|uniref:hypothetical protein n=1 Tax=Ferruginibacter sp. SUN106 TaxID=2978348 RepID=UPI003D363923
MILDITGTIIIPQNHQLVFEYFSNFANDKLWRKEVKATKVNSEKICVGTSITQYSFLSKKEPYYKSEFTCTEFAANKIMVCETNRGDQFWLKTTRQVTPLTENNTLITYRLQFDTAIVKHGLGFALPHFLVRIYTQQTMKQYLRVLKNSIAKENQHAGFITYPYYAGD